MKKILSILLSVLILTTSISFAYNNDKSLDITNTYLKDLNKVEQDLHLVIKGIMNCKYDSDSVIKSLDLDKSLILGIYANSSMNYKDKSMSKAKNRELSNIIYVSSLYSLSLNALYLYLEDEDKNDTYLMDAIFHYHVGTTKLKEIQSNKN